MSHSLRRLASFLVVGGIGFLVDVTILWIAMEFSGFNLFLARAFSFLCAVTSTWLMNRAWVFGDREKKSRLNEYLLYLASSSTAGCANYTVFALLMLTLSGFKGDVILAVAAGTLSGLTLNFLAYDRLVFVPRSTGMQQ